MFRFVLVGCGRISQQHLAGFARLPDECEVVAVCDASEERAREAAALVPGAVAFTDLDLMLRSTQADCALVGTPSGMHPDHVAKVLDAGLHAVTEKPMALTVAAADRMIAHAARAGKRLFVVKQLRLLPSMQRLHAAIRDGQLGKLYLGQVNVFFNRPQSYYDEAPWRGSRAMDGGVLLNQASHYLDLLLWLFGEPVSVGAQGGTLARTIESEDTMVATLRFASGAVASINCTVLTFPQNIEGSLTVLAERGSVKLGGRGLNEVVFWETAANIPRPPPEDLAFREPGAGHAAVFRQIVRALQGECASIIDGEEGRRSLVLIEEMLAAVG